jgi:hypothetical protein
LERGQFMGLVVVPQGDADDARFGVLTSHTDG